MKQIEKHLKKYNEVNEKIRAFKFFGFITGWDSQTEAPKNCFDTRAKYLGVLSEEMYKLSTNEEYEAAALYLNEHKKELEPWLAREVEKRARDISDTKKIPMEEYVEYEKLMAVSENKYFECKVNNDFASFAPYLEKIVAWHKKLIGWLSTKERKGYDILLDKYEEGFTESDYDKFFDVLKVKLVPFVKKVTPLKLKYDDGFLKEKYPAALQEDFCKYLQGVMNFDMTRGVMKKSEHPFTTGVDTQDVRFTVHYYEDNFLSAIYSAIHEMGHGTYEQQVETKFDDTLSGGGVSLGMHESQSRFYENIIGRSYVFWKAHLPALKERFPKQLKDVSAEDMLKAVNTSRASFVRVEADELTYPLHIMLRYDMEKMFITGDLKVVDFPQAWNKLMREYLGLEVKSDKQGVLQDVHWAGGMIGYFPTYALGSAYAAQLYHKMRQEIDVDKIIASGNLKEINNWLKEKVHRFGASKSPKEILKDATGEDFNPDYYVNYLIDKYSKVYGIKA